MILHQVVATPAPELAQSLGAFERDFTYPLGPDRSFRIDHGADYGRFFRAMGEAGCFVISGPDGVLGTLGAALRQLLLPNGSERPVVYLGDLKIAPRARGGLVLRRLVRAAMAWVGARADAALCVVMDGTRVTPIAYTGRAGIPYFRELGHVAVWRLATHGAGRADDEHFLVTEEVAVDCYRRLSLGRYASAGGIPAERSEAVPMALMHPGRLACGVLEDTGKAKRLIADDGSELRSMHLSYFAWRIPEAGSELLQVARRRAAQQGYPALFVSVAAAEAELLQAALAESAIVMAPATIYGTGLSPGRLWNINTSEI